MTIASIRKSFVNVNRRSRKSRTLLASRTPCHVDAVDLCHGLANSIHAGKADSSPLDFPDSEAHATLPDMPSIRSEIFYDATVFSNASGDSAVTVQAEPFTGIPTDSRDNDNYIRNSIHAEVLDNDTVFTTGVIAEPSHTLNSIFTQNVGFATQSPPPVTSTDARMVAPSLVQCSYNSESTPENSSMQFLPAEVHELSTVFTK